MENQWDEPTLEEDELLNDAEKKPAADDTQSTDVKT